MENKNTDEENLNKNADVGTSELEEGYESEDDDTSIDLETETTMECEINPSTPASDLREEDKRMLHEMIQQIASEYGGYNLDNAALESFEDTTAAWLIGFFEDANKFAERQGRVTVKLEDVVSVARLRGVILHKEDADNNSDE